jgi:histidinol-phosphatase
MPNRRSTARLDQSDVALGLQLAWDTVERSVHLFDSAFSVGMKSDGTSVTSADIDIERQLVTALRRERPSDGILSEEAGSLGDRSTRRWILDPIDGTKQFAAQVDGWGTHIALEIEDEIVFGVITRPLRSTIWWAATGVGAWRESRASGAAETVRSTCRTSTTSALRGCRVGMYAAMDSSVRTVVTGLGASIELGEGRENIIDLVEGRLDAVVSHQRGAAWDHAPAVVLVREAGGSYRDCHGLQRCDAGGGIYSNSPLASALWAELGSHLAH